MSTGFTRRSLATGIGTAGLGVGGLALLASDALAQTPFTSFAFQATGAPTARTMPDRLAEVKNVKDFGAVGDDTTDDTAAIQNAVNWTANASRGTIFFPTGKYKITAPITFNASGISIRFLGEGMATLLDAKSFVSGGYVLDRALGSPSNTAQVVIENLSLSGDATVSGSIRVGSCSSVAVRDCFVGGTLTTEDSPGNSSQNILIETVKFAGGGDGLVMGGPGVVLGCDFVNYNVAARMYGNGWIMTGNRIENCNTAYLLGVDSAGTDRGASGFAIWGGTTEGNWTSMDFSGTCSGFYIGSLSLLGHGPSNAGSSPPTSKGTQYGIFVRANKASYGVFSGITSAGPADVAGIEIDAATSRANLLFTGCNSTQLGGAGQGWVTPLNAYTAQFQNSNIAPIWTYSQLPTTANVLEGDEFSISDSTTNAWGANVTVGAGGDPVLVRWNGANWTVVAK